MTGCAGCDYADLQRELRAEFPRYSTLWKKNIPLMRVIDVFLKVITLGMMSTFMTGYITTIGFTVYLPEQWASMTDEARTIVLRHERVHMRQRVKYGSVLFSFLYLFFPLPFVCAYFRMKFEQEAYAESMLAIVEIQGNLGVRWINSSTYEEETIRQFTGPAYFWMWPFRGRIVRWLHDTRGAIVMKHQAETAPAILPA